MKIIIILYSLGETQGISMKPRYHSARVGPFNLKHNYLRKVAIFDTQPPFSRFNKISVNDFLKLDGLPIFLYIMSCFFWNYGLLPTATYIIIINPVLIAVELAIKLI